MDSKKNNDIGHLKTANFAYLSNRCLDTRKANDHAGLRDPDFFRLTNNFLVSPECATLKDFKKLKRNNMNEIIELPDGTMCHVDVDKGTEYICKVEFPDGMIFHYDATDIDIPYKTEMPNGDVFFYEEIKEHAKEGLLECAKLTIFQKTKKEH